MVSFVRVLPSSEKATKIFDALVAKTNNLLHGTLKEKIFYLHIHKCGGISIQQAIKACYHTLDVVKQRQIFHILNSRASFNAVQTAVNQTNFSFDKAVISPEMEFREKLLLYYMYQEHINFIAGHFSFNAAAYQYFSDKYAFVTVLRDPVERWISLYFYNRYNKGGHRNIDTEITEHLKSARGQRQGHAYVEWIGGLNKERDYTSEEAINRAKENLHKFSVVGCLEYQENFVSRFEDQFGRRLIIRKLNQNPKSKIDRNSIITKEIKEEIREICKPDVEVYQYAVDNLVKAKT